MIVGWFADSLSNSHSRFPIMRGRVDDGHHRFDWCAHATSTKKRRIRIRAVDCSISYSACPICSPVMTHSPFSFPCRSPSDIRSSREIALRPAPGKMIAGGLTIAKRRRLLERVTFFIYPIVDGVVHFTSNEPISAAVPQWILIAAFPLLSASVMVNCSAESPTFSVFKGSSAM